VVAPVTPKSWYLPTKPHKFCPGCGHGIVLKALGENIDELGIQDKTIFGCDIGCSLLSWNFFACDSTQTHHGRTTPVMVGIKRSRPELVTVGYMGDGGGYSIGSQHLVNAAVRNEKLTLILVNNTNYGMTGGQMAPTTLPGQKPRLHPTGATPSLPVIPPKGRSSYPPSHRIAPM
jgi:2-oxoglutarate ferredoxin oxidoreductase, beta subunit (EC 1.2.7.3)